MTLLRWRWRSAEMRAKEGVVAGVTLCASWSGGSTCPLSALTLFSFSKEGRKRLTISRWNVEFFSRKSVWHGRQLLILNSKRDFPVFTAWSAVVKVEPRVLIVFIVLTGNINGFHIVYIIRYQFISFKFLISKNPNRSFFFFTKTL